MCRGGIITLTSDSLSVHMGMWIFYERLEKKSKFIPTEKRIVGHDITLTEDGWRWKCGMKIMRLVKQDNQVFQFFRPPITQLKPPPYVPLTIEAERYWATQSFNKSLSSFCLSERKAGGRAERGRWRWTSNVLWRKTRMQERKSTWVCLLE